MIVKRYRAFYIYRGQLRSWTLVYNTIKPHKKSNHNSTSYYIIVKIISTCNKISKLTKSSKFLFRFAQVPFMKLICSKLHFFKAILNIFKLFLLRPFQTKEPLKTVPSKFTLFSTISRVLINSWAKFLSQVFLYKALRRLVPGFWLWGVPVEIKTSYRRPASISLTLQHLFDVWPKPFFLIGVQATAVTIEITVTYDRLCWKSLIISKSSHTLHNENFPNCSSPKICRPN